MPDYIFNDGNPPVNNNFSTGPDRTVLNPISPAFREPPKAGFSKKAAALICAATVLLGGLAGRYVFRKRSLSRTAEIAAGCATA